MIVNVLENQSARCIAGAVFLIVDAVYHALGAVAREGERISKSGGLTSTGFERYGFDSPAGVSPPLVRTDSQQKLDAPRHTSTG